MRPGPRVLCLAVIAASLATSAGPARAQAPAQKGWWTATNPGSAQGLPAPPAPPDVPADGLLVEGGPSSTSGADDAGPTAYAALVYQLPANGSVGKLTLTVATGSATTPNATLQLCPLQNAGFFPSQGGPVTEGPQFDCSHHVTAQASADGTSYGFDVAALVVDDALAVAVLPTSVTDRVVLSAPGADSLVVRQSFGSTSSEGEPSTTSEPSPPDGEPATIPPAGTGSAVLQPPPAAAIDPVTAQAQPTVSQAPENPPPTTATQLTSAGHSTSGPSPVWVAALIVAACLGWSLWTAAGRAAVRRSIPQSDPPSRRTTQGSAR